MAALSSKNSSHNTNKRFRRTSGGNPNGERGELTDRDSMMSRDGDGLANASPMSALPSPTFADMASSFLNASDYRTRSPRSSLGANTAPSSAIKVSDKSHP